MRDVISRYFGLGAHRDREGIVALFADDAIVVDEGTTYRGTKQIRVYTTEVLSVEASDPDRYLATGRLTGDFPGGTADLRWDFTVADDQIKRLVIAP
jgi:hypothetical protein